MKRVVNLFAFLSLVSLSPFPLSATDAPPPVIEQIFSSGSQKSLRFTPYPGAQAYTFFSATNPTGPFTINTNFVLAPYLTGYTLITNTTTNGPVVVTITNLAYEWRLTNFTAPSAFFRLGVTPVNSNVVSGANVLNRLAYGPTPDDLEIYGTNAQAYIDQQLNMNGIPETMDNFTIESSNAIPSDPTTNWVYVTVTATVSGSTGNGTNLFLFMTAPGDVYIDDLMLVEGTNAGVGPNLLLNGDFEAPLAAPWVLSGTVASAGTATAGTVAHGGSSSLHLTSTAAGSTTANNLKYGFSPALVNGTKVTLSYWYLTSATSSKLRIQFLSTGTMVSSGGGLPTPPTWTYVKATGTASATSRLYMYLTAAGDCYVDDMKLVAGPDAEVGANLLANGDFESTTSPWVLAARYVTNTAISADIAHSGSGSLHLIGTSGGSGTTGASMYQNITPSLVNGQTYTLSYWYLPTAPGNSFKANLDGSGLLSTPDTDVSGLYRRLNTGAARLADYRAWFCLHAVTSQRQLFEILSQFWENHFVTQQSKTVDYLTGKGYDSTTAGIVATDWEAREMINWRNAMLDPSCTFYDLLKISAESKAMIVYLDTVDSKGNGNNIANENYARELLELFTFGVDNGYDQNDIIILSRAWTGWSVDVVDAPNANDPFAPISVTYTPNSNSTAKANTVGVWALHFNTGNHGTNRGALFGGKTVPARFGPPWAGTPYQLTIPPRTGTAGMQDGYDVLTHLANQPFTSEYLSVKLCRLFVHDDFPNPNTTDPASYGYTFYDYTNPNRTAEAELVHQCMLAWENSSPKGNLRAVLATIFNSDLFRSHTAAAQKVKTPLEFVASSVRALRSVNPDGSATASTDGYSFATPLNNMGQMLLFDRDAPDGYPESGPNWISAGTLVERLRYVQAYCMTNGSANRADAGNNLCDPVKLLKKKVTAGSWNDATAVANYFLGLLYPAEGAANLDLYRAAAVKFLNTKDDGVTTENFSGLNNTSITYDNRVRSLVAMLFTLQRFQEQ